MVALGAAHYRGAVQLMSGRGAAVLEHVKGVGLQHKLNMLPVLKKPFETDAIITVTRDLKLGMPPAVATRLELDEALASKWIEFWYQPKIELRKKRLAGAEAYARARHPQHGIVLPSAFMPGAQEPALVKLGEHALNSALTTAARFSELGVHLKLTVNIPLNALAKLPVADIVKAHKPGPKWPGLIIACRRIRSSASLRSPPNWRKAWKRRKSGWPSTISAAAIRRCRNSPPCLSPSSSSTAPSSPIAAPTGSTPRFARR